LRYRTAYLYRPLPPWAEDGYEPLCRDAETFSGTSQDNMHLI
jgi:hypothetical protein